MTQDARAQAIAAMERERVWRERQRLWLVIVQSREIAHRLNDPPIAPIVQEGCWP